MLARLFAVLFGTRQVPVPDGRAGFDALNRHAPLKSDPGPERARSADTAQDNPSGFICRETVLGRDQCVAGYQFMLHEGTRNRIRNRSRRIQHVYAEVLVRNIAQLDVGRLLEHRLAFLDLPDSFLAHPSIADLPPKNTVLVVTRLGDDGAPTPGALLETVRGLRNDGYRIAIPEAEIDLGLGFLAPEADHIVVPAASTDPERIRELALRYGNSHVTLIARELPTQDEFALCFTLGVVLFQGAFISRREDWRGNRLGPNTARLAELLARLRRDADTHELAELLKQDPALSLRLMRYINSAAVGLREEVSSIERALMQLGRDKLYRWLMLLMYGADKGTTRTGAILENALVRARMMELLGEGRTSAERDALFLVGLLSLVDVVLRVPMQEAMASLATAPEIEAAVVRGEGPMADLLRLAIACETDDPEALASLAERCGVGPGLATRRHLEAFAWALDVNR